MFEHYFAALLSLRQPRGLAHSALPDAPVQPERVRLHARAPLPLVTGGRGQG